MEKFRDFQTLRSLIEEGERLGLDFSILRAKVEEYIASQSSNVIKMVLLGSFSDGKTTAIAGMLGKLESNMKIDEDESSDELSVYSVDSLGTQYEIVDTPGLFGTKEKEVEGRSVRFSEITERYISEAHVVIYVCNSVNTLKDSHKDIIRKVLRDYKKLGATVFVINKMDEVADTNDSEDYAEMADIKRKTFVDRLKQVISLTVEEEKQLHIACIAANPRGEGLAYWFERKDEYLRRSHIGQLEQCIKALTQKCDVKELRQNTDTAVSKDLTKNIAVTIGQRVSELAKINTSIYGTLKDMKSDLAILKRDINASKGTMTNRLSALRESLLSSINSLASLPDLASFVETRLGRNRETVDCHILLREINQIFDECTESNNAVLEPSMLKIDREISGQEKLLDSPLIKKGLGSLQKVNNTTVLKVRNLVAKSYKFKPWGATKLAKGIGKAAGAVAVALEAWNLYQKWRDNQKLEGGKKSLTEAITDIFREVFVSFDSSDEYYQNFAPTYLELSRIIEERDGQLSAIVTDENTLKDYKRRVADWYGGSIDDVDFEEIS